jgi:hypothetical protein
VTRLAHHDARTLFEQAWAEGVATGLITPDRREAMLAEGTRAIRRIATVLGTDHLREDLERALRSMLGLVNLHLHKVSGGEVTAAARSLAANGLLFHTKGASQAIKRVLAIETGQDPAHPDPAQKRYLEEAVVIEWAHLSFDEFAERERSAEQASRRRAAAVALVRTLQGDVPDAFYEPDQIILTALLVLAYEPARVWVRDPQGFERLLGAVRRSPQAFSRLPAGLPAGHEAVIAEVWAAQGRQVLQAITGNDIPIHLLVAGDPLTNPLQTLLVLPGDALSTTDELSEQTTAHWERLTGGAADEANLLVVMLRGVYGFTSRVPFSPKVVEGLLKKTLTARPDDRLIEDWLEANAPHQYHDGLQGLWDDFWDERESLDGGATAQDYLLLAVTWLPVKASSKA